MPTLPRLAACFALCLAANPARAAGQVLHQLTFAAPALGERDLDTSIPKLAAEVAAVYRTSNRDSLLDVRFRLQLARGQYDSAALSIRRLTQLRVARGDSRAQTRALNADYELFARAKAGEAKGQAFDRALSSAFASIVTPLDNETAAFVVRAARITRAQVQGELRQAIAEARGQPRLSLASALALIRAYVVVRVHTELPPAAQRLVAADDERRYVIERNIRVPVGDGATVCTNVMRPRGSRGRLPALLEFTIYADTAGTNIEARRTASHDYVAVTGFTRGKLCSDGPVVPYRHDGADEAALIDWISRQPWSDGRVGTYSGSYEGFTQWAALKNKPRALKAIMAGATNGPGVDTPMEGNIFWNFIYPWPFYTTDTKTLDTATYFDFARWQKLNHDWYVSGRAYRDLDRIDGTPNPVFDEWLSHPEYDAYWQSLVPYGNEFASIDIPVLQTAGYYFGGPGAVTYYFTQHYAHDPHANHYLVIGPYGHPEAQRGVVDALGDTAVRFAGYDLDPVARLNLMTDLRYPWFDWVIKGKPRPWLLADKVNYEVVRANVWRHAPSIAAMSNARLRFYLSSASERGRLRLSQQPPRSGDSSRTLVVNLADRSDVDRNPPGGGVRDAAIDTVGALVYMSDPVKEPTEIAGFFSGRLDVITNKRDFDLGIAMFELTPKGEYFQLPPFQARASHVNDIEHRHLLTPGAMEHLDYTAIRLAAHRMEAGSRIVLVFAPIKNPGQEINYGTGKVVADETIADAGEPLRIAVSPTSYVDLPVAIH